MTNANLHSPLSDAVSRLAQNESRANRQAVIQALASSVAFVCVPSRPEIVQTGKEPHFQIREVLGRRITFNDTPEFGLQLFLFSTRASADSFCTKVPGFAAEPIACAVAAEAAVRADATLAIDPLGATVLLSHAEIEWGPRRPPTSQSFPDALEAWILERSVERMEAMRKAFRDTVFYLHVARPELLQAIPELTQQKDIACVVIHSRLLELILIDGVWLLHADTDRAAKERLTGQSGFFTLAVDGPALAEAAILANAELGIAVRGQNRLALNLGELRDEWPRRTMTADDF